MSAKPLSEISLRGKVTDKEKNLPISNAEIKAVDKMLAREITQITGPDGAYELRLPPGVWKITAAKAGYGKAEIEEDFKADKVGQDFSLPVGFRLTGTVYWSNNQGRVEKALVKATPLENQAQGVRYTPCDDDGDFEFKLLEPGKWNIVALHENSLPSRQPVEVAGDKDTYGFPLKLDWRMGEPDARRGKLFLGILSAGLVLLVLLYIGLHALIRPEPDPLITGMVNTLTQGLAAVEKAEKPSQVTALDVTIATINDTWTALSASSKGFRADEQQFIKNLLTNLQIGFQKDDKTAVQSNLQALKESLEAKAVTGFFWIGEPWRFLEVLFWGLAGILVYLITQTGYYLRWERFYIQGLPMHLSQLVAVPLLSLVFVLLLSQVSLNVTLSGSTVQLDVSDPRLLAAVSFIIASQPWNLIGFIRETSGRWTSREEVKKVKELEVQTQP